MTFQLWGTGKFNIMRQSQPSPLHCFCQVSTRGKITNTWIYNYENDINEFGSVHGFRHTLEVMGGILHSKGRPLCLGSLAEFFFFFFTWKEIHILLSRKKICSGCVGGKQRREGPPPGGFRLQTPEFKLHTHFGLFWLVQSRGWKLSKQCAIAWAREECAVEKCHGAGYRPVAKWKYLHFRRLICD